MSNSSQKDMKEGYIVSPVEFYFRNALQTSIAPFTSLVNSKNMHNVQDGTAFWVTEIITSSYRFNITLKAWSIEGLPEPFSIKNVLRELEKYQTALLDARAHLRQFDWYTWCTSRYSGSAKKVLDVPTEKAKGLEIELGFATPLRCLHEYIQYCTAIQTASKKNVLGMTSDCELSKYLQKQGIVKQEANQFCARLGAVLVQHLTHFVDQIWALPMDNASKMKLQELVQQRAQDADPAVRAFKNKEKSTLAEMHAFLEAL